MGDPWIDVGIDARALVVKIWAGLSALVVLIMVCAAGCFIVTRRVRPVEKLD